MTAISLSEIVTELSRVGSRRAYCLVSDTNEKVIEMYALVKKEILARGTPHRIIDFSKGLANLLNPYDYQLDSPLLLLENTASVSVDESERINTYVKQLTDCATSSLLWYLSIDTLGQLTRGYGSRAREAFQVISKVIPDA